MQGTPATLIGNQLVPGAVPYDELEQLVKAELAKTLKPERLRAEGRADAESLADNGSPAGRAKNRRVELTLIVKPAA